MYNYLTFSHEYNWLNVCSLYMSSFGYFQLKINDIGVGNGLIYSASPLTYFDSQSHQIVYVLCVVSYILVFQRNYLSQYVFSINMIYRKEQFDCFWYVITYRNTLCFCTFSHIFARTKHKRMQDLYYFIKTTLY